MDSADEETPFLYPKSSGDHSQKGTSDEKDVRVLGSAFLLVFLAYGAVQNLQSTVNSEGNLGTTCLGILYVSFTICSVFSSLVVRTMGSKYALVLGTTGYWLFTAANLKPSWNTMVPASIYLGFASSIIWVGQVIGNLISFFLLGNAMEGAVSGTNLLFTVYLCNLTLGIILMCFLHKRDDNEGRKDSTTHSIFSLASISKSVTAPLSDIRLLLIIPLFAYSGLQQAFVWAEFTKNIVKPALGASAVGGPMALYGAFNAMCSLVAGRLTSNLKSVTLIVGGGAFSQAVILLWIMLKYSTTSGVLGIIYPLVMAAAWGVGDGALNTQINAMIGMLFSHDMQGTFAQLKLWQSASIAALFFLTPNISLHAMAIILLIALLFAIAIFLFLTLRVERAFSRSLQAS